jgi:hypothetical protein
MEIENKDYRLPIIAAIREKRDRFYRKIGPREHEKWRSEIIEKIKTHYGDLEVMKYTLWHVFIGGGDQLGCENFDFPGEYSIQKIIEDLPE